MERKTYDELGKKDKVIYMANLKALYGDGAPIAPRAPKKKKKSNIPTEWQEQVKLCTWLDRNHIRYFAIPNGGKRNLLEAAKLKRSGVKAGVPDIFLPIPSYHTSGLKTKWRHGLWIELKRVSAGIVSTAQKEWIDYLNQQGYVAVVAYGALEAMQIVREYLNFHEPLIA